MNEKNYNPNEGAVGCDGCGGGNCGDCSNKLLKDLVGEESLATYTASPLSRGSRSLNVISIDEYVSDEHGREINSQDEPEDKPQKDLLQKLSDSDLEPNITNAPGPSASEVVPHELEIKALDKEEEQSLLEQKIQSAQFLESTDHKLIESRYGRLGINNKGEIDIIDSTGLGSLEQFRDDLIDDSPGTISKEQFRAYIQELYDNGYVLVPVVDDEGNRIFTNEWSLNSDGTVEWNIHQVERPKEPQPQVLVTPSPDDFESNNPQIFEPIYSQTTETELADIQTSTIYFADMPATAFAEANHTSKESNGISLVVDSTQIVQAATSQSPVARQSFKSPGISFASLPFLNLDRFTRTAVENHTVSAKESVLPSSTIENTFFSTPVIHSEKVFAFESATTENIVVVQGVSDGETDHVTPKKQTKENDLDIKRTDSQRLGGNNAKLKMESITIDLENDLRNPATLYIERSAEAQETAPAISLSNGVSIPKSSETIRPTSSQELPKIITENFAPEKEPDDSPPSLQINNQTGEITVGTVIDQPATEIVVILPDSPPLITELDPMKITEIDPTPPEVTRPQSIEKLQDFSKEIIPSGNPEAFEAKAKGGNPEATQSYENISRIEKSETPRERLEAQRVNIDAQIKDAEKTLRILSELRNAEGRRPGPLQQNSNPQASDDSKDIVRALPTRPQAAIPANLPVAA
jgi:hypothetical protein